MKAIVSVVVPIYNVQDYLRQCLDSILGQSMSELEVICLDDGSTDGSPAIIDEYAARDARIVPVHVPNGGYGKAVNRGIDLASGECLCIVEPDDFIDRDMFRILYAALKRFEVPLAKSAWYDYWDGEPERKVYRSVTQDKRDGLVDAFETPVLYVTNPSIWTALYDLAWLRRCGIRCNETPGASYQDAGFVLKTYLSAGKFYVSNRPFYWYRQTNANSSVKNTSKVYCIFDEFTCMDAYCAQAGLQGNVLSAILCKRKLSMYFWDLALAPAHLHKEIRCRMRGAVQEDWRQGGRTAGILTMEEKEILSKLCDSFFRRIALRLCSACYSRTKNDGMVRIRLFGIRVFKRRLASKQSSRSV